MAPLCDSVRSGSSPPAPACPTPDAKQQANANTARPAIGFVISPLQLARRTRGFGTEIRQSHPPALLHRRLVRADAGASPVHRLIHIRERCAALYDTGYELVYQVRMRSAVPAALYK